MKKWLWLLILVATPALADPIDNAQVLRAWILNPPRFAQISGQTFTFDASKNLMVNCAVGCGGGSGGTASNFGAAFPTAGTAIGVKNGTNMVNLAADASSNLLVNCAVGCAGGSFNNNSDAVATSSTNGQAAAWLYGFNGTTFDRLRVDGSKNLLVSVNAALPAGTNLLGHVITDSGSTTAVTGNVTVVQGTGTNLHTFVDSGTVTANAGTNLNTSALALDTSVNGILVGQGSTTSGQKGPLAQAAVTTSAPSYTTAQTSPLSLNTSGGLRTDGSGVTQPISAAALPLPTGAAVSADQCGFSGSNCNVNDAQQGGTNITTVPVAVGSGTPSGNAPNVNAALFQGTTAVTNDGTAGVPAVGGHKADNGVAAGTDRVPALPCVYETDYENGSAATQGRNGASECGTDGLTWTAQLPAIRPASYHASASFAGSSTTFAFHIAGNATDTVLVTKIMFTCTQTTAGTVTVTVNKTSAASTGGTAATMTAVPDDSNYAAASSVAQSFTGTGPTAGTPVGQVDAAKIGCIATSTATPNDVYVLNLRQKPIVLRGTAQTLEVGVGGAVTGGNFTGTVEWIETKTIVP